MKKFFSFFYTLLILSVAGCDIRVISLKQNYQDIQYKFSVSSSKEATWEKLTDLLAARGLALINTDKSSGLITTAATSFINSYSFENKDGSLANPEALVVCNKVRGPFTNPTSFKPTFVTGQWMITTRQDNNKTLVSIMLANPSGETVIPATESELRYNLTVKSTGKFEKEIEGAFNK